MSDRNEKIKEIIRDLAARFLSMNGNGSSLLTVTRVELTPDGKRATIFFTVFPTDFEKTAVEFAERKINDFKDFIKEKSKLGRIPFLSFQIDTGEKNRQKIDDLLNQN
jgi:ribosome-binding factor A